MNDERRKVLTEYLGECWHETFGELQKDTMFFTCQKCGKEFHFADTEIGIQRTFDTDAAMMALFRKMVNKKDYDRFRFVTKERLTFALPVGTFDEQWLFYDPERFCNLVAEWLEVKK
jgi:hypothetical protein